MLLIPVFYDQFGMPHESCITGWLGVCDSRKCPRLSWVG